MQIHISPRHLQLTASIHQAVAGHILTLEDYGIDIVGAHVVLQHDAAASAGERFAVRVHLAVAGQDIFAQNSGDDLYLTLEKVSDKLARQLRKRKTSLVDKRRSVDQRAAERQRVSGELPRSIRKAVTPKSPGNTKRALPAAPRA